MKPSKASSARAALLTWQGMRPRLFAISIITGLVTGVVISLMRLAIHQVADASLKLVLWGRGGVLSAIITLVVYTLLGLLAAFLLKKEPNISGSGIPQISAELSGKMTQKWQRVLPLKLMGGLLSLGGGLTMGREGPSVQIGGSVGAGVADLLRRPEGERGYLITGGAAAGLAAAFNAPISGVVFALEELHRHFSPRVLLSAMTAAFVSDFVSVNIFGLQPVLAFAAVTPVPLSQYWALLIIGLLAGLSGILFSRGILMMKSLYNRMRRLPFLLRGVLPFVLTCAILLIDPSLFGSGEELIFLPVHGNLAPLPLLMRYLVKLLLCLTAFGSGIAGGIFFPLLVLGSLLGNLTAQLLAMLGLIDQSMVLVLSLLAMAAHFAAIVRSPLTGILLIAEMTGSFTFMLPLGLVSLIAYMLAEALRSAPIYESLLEQLPCMQEEGKKQADQPSGRIVKEYVVADGSPAAGKRIDQVKWPRGLLIVGVLRGSEELSPTADQVIQPGDYLLILGKTGWLASQHTQLQHLLSL